MIDIKNKNGVIVVSFDGRLDSQTAREAQESLKPVLDDADKEIVLDCAKLDYISSPGLRLFLAIKKATTEKGGNVIIQNIINDVKNVFLLTGFDEFFEFRNS